MKKIIISFLILAAILIIILAMRVFSGEDDWICDGKSKTWIKHGYPNTPMPEGPCGED